MFLVYNYIYTVSIAVLNQEFTQNGGITNVQCSGGETHIYSCEYDTIIGGDCSPAAVQCQCKPLK